MCLTSLLLLSVCVCVSAVCACVCLRIICDLRYLNGAYTKFYVSI